MNTSRFARWLQASHPLLAVVLAALPAAAQASTHMAGMTIYQKAGCVACHGADARGGPIAPPLAGHSAEQVKRSVRNPQGIMPRFGDDKLTEKELGALAAYIASLEAGPAGAALEFPGALAAHHWMAHHALRSNDAEHGIHHLGHARELAKDQAHRADIDRALALARAKRLEEAAHAVVEMVSSKVTPDVPMEKLHLRLALGSIDDGNTKEVQHHLQHYVDGTSLHNRKHAEELLALVKKGDLATVKKRLAHLLGV